jgi:uncharacterized membrane protein YidH (DUF202 family)
MGEITVKDPAATQGDSATQLAQLRTDLALERTALSMIGFGFTIGKLGQAIDEIEVKRVLGTSLRTVSAAAENLRPWITTP